MLWVIRYPCSSLGRPRIHDISKMSNFYLVTTGINKKDWMDGKLFEEWFRELDRKFSFEGKNVAFVMDICPAYPHIDNFKAIKLYFLPPNTTSKTQPIDQGVICSFKAKYCKNVVQKIIQSVENRRTPRKILLRQEMQMLVST